ncbi:hypothetical protein B0H13DRAFT_2154266 [Mycena leptocephala]|nr:hypothetical protein B0H13DRAFT_2154266 [Mycena leptocephala]
MNDVWQKLLSAQECTACTHPGVNGHPSCPRSQPSLWRPMSSNGVDTAELLQLIADSRLTGYLAVAALCVLMRVLYDHIVCFPKEVELMWKSRWGLAKIVYLWNRYFSLIAIRSTQTLLSLHSDTAQVIVREIETETSLSQVQGVTSTLVIAAVDFVLMLRVWIMYGRPQLLIWLFAFLGINKIAVDFFAYAEMTVLKGCYAYNVPRFLTIYAATPLIVTFIMFVLTVYKCITKLWRTADEVVQVWKLFLRDGVLWFLAVFAAAGAALLIWTMRRETLKQLLVVVYSTVASRALLNIKAIMAEAEPRTERNEIRSGERIVFMSVSNATSAGP